MKKNICLFFPHRNATLLRTYRRRSTVVGRRRAVQSNAVGRSQYRLLQTTHGYDNRWSECLRKGHQGKPRTPLYVYVISKKRHYLSSRMPFDS